MPYDFISEWPPYSRLKGTLINPAQEIQPQGLNNTLQASQAIQANVPPPYQVPQVQPSPINIQNIPPTPHASQMSTNADQMPQLSQIHHGKLRTILDAIAGGIGGLGGHPEYGAQSRNREYDRAMTDFKNKQAAITPIAKNEMTDRTTGLNLGRYSSQEQLKADIANAANSLNLHKANMQDVQKESHESRLVNTMAKMASPELKAQLHKKLADQLKAGEIDQDYYDASVQMLGGGVPLTKVQAKTDIATAAAEPKAAGAARGRTSVELSPPVIQKQAELSGAKSAASTQAHETVIDSEANAKAKANRDRIIAEAKAETARMATERKIQGLKESYNKTPIDNRRHFIDSLPKEEKLAFLAQPDIDTQHITTSPAQDQLVKTATTALNHMDTLKKYLKDPDIGPNIGAILGTLNKQTQQFGGSYTAKTPEEAKKVQQFLTFANNAYAFEVKNAVGGRPAHQIWEGFASSAPGARKDVNANLGAIAGIEDSALNYIDGLIGKRHEDNKDTPKKQDSIWDRLKVK